MLVLAGGIFSWEGNLYVKLITVTFIMMWECVKLWKKEENFFYKRKFFWNASHSQALYELQGIQVFCGPWLKNHRETEIFGESAKAWDQDKAVTMCEDFLTKDKWPLQDSFNRLIEANLPQQTCLLYIWV